MDRRKARGLHLAAAGREPHQRRWRWAFRGRPIYVIEEQGDGYHAFAGARHLDFFDSEQTALQFVDRVPTNRPAQHLASDGGGRGRADDPR